MNPETEGRGGMRTVEEGLSRFTGINQYLSRAGIFFSYLHYGKGRRKEFLQFHSFWSFYFLYSSQQSEKEKEKKMRIIF
jgi:hypothetical protein